MENLTIGRLAKKVGVTVDTVRFYERCGLIAEPARTKANYRIYPEADVERLHFIVQAKKLGFTLHEIKEILTLRHDPAASKADIKQRTEIKIKDIKDKIADLAKILAALEHLADSCDGHGSLDDCPILAAMSSGNCH